MGFKMNKEQQELFDQLTPLQQEVSVNSISGMNDIDAYKASRGKAKTIKSMEASVSEILSNPKVARFVSSMKGEAVNAAVMSRQEMLERLSGLARTNMSDLIEWRTGMVTGDDGEQVEQSMWAIKESAQLDPLKAASIAEVTAGKDGLKIKQHSPLTAMKMISDMQGFNAPVKTEQSGAVTIIQMSKEEYEETRRKMLEEDDC